MPLVKLKPKNQVTIPAALSKQVGIATGDFLEAQIDGRGRITLTPKVIVSLDREKLPAEVLAGIKKGLDDVRKGHTHGPFNTVEEMMANLNKRIAELKIKKRRK